MAEAARLTAESKRGLLAAPADWFSAKVTGLADPTQFLYIRHQIGHRHQDRTRNHDRFHHLKKVGAPATRPLKRFKRVGSERDTYFEQKAGLVQ